MSDRKQEEADAIVWKSSDAEREISGLLVWSIEKATFIQHFHVLLATGWVRHLVLYQQSLAAFLLRDDCEKADEQDAVKNHIRSWKIEDGLIERLCFIKPFDLEKEIVRVKEERESKRVKS